MHLFLFLSSWDNSPFLSFDLEPVRPYHSPISFESDSNTIVTCSFLCKGVFVSGCFLFSYLKTVFQVWKKWICFSGSSFFIGGSTFEFFFHFSAKFPFPEKLLFHVGGVFHLWRFFMFDGFSGSFLFRKKSLFPHWNRFAEELQSLQKNLCYLYKQYFT